MADELAIKKEGVVSLIENNELGNMIKPLVKEIHLFDSYIAGTMYIDDRTIFAGLESGEELVLRREGDNKFDGNAILVLNKDKAKLGYIPERDNVVFARLMDAGKMLKARVSGIDRNGDFYKISIGIYLVDF